MCDILVNPFQITCKTNADGGKQTQIPFYFVSCNNVCDQLQHCSCPYLDFHDDMTLCQNQRG